MTAKDERRRHERIPLKYKIVLNIEEKSVIGTLVNISACGASFSVGADELDSGLLIVGSIINFALASDSSYMNFSGAIVRKHEDGQRVYIAVTFY